MPGGSGGSAIKRPNPWARDRKKLGAGLDQLKENLTCYSDTYRSCSAHSSILQIMIGGQVSSSEHVDQ